MSMITDTVTNQLTSIFPILSFTEDKTTSVIPEQTPDYTFTLWEKLKS